MLLGSAERIIMAEQVYHVYPIIIALIDPCGILPCLQVKRKREFIQIATLLRNCYLRQKKNRVGNYLIDGKTMPFIKMIAAGP